MARKSGVCTSGYVCVISDGYVSDEGRKAEIDRLIKKFKNLTFLVDGMPVEDKVRRLKKRTK